MGEHHDPGRDARAQAESELAASAAGDAAARARLVESLYDELRTLAANYFSREQPGHTLQPTALVHEAWIRLIPQEKQFEADRSHFMALAAIAMRRVLADHARKKRRREDLVGKRVDLPSGSAALADGYDNELWERIDRMHEILEDLHLNPKTIDVALAVTYVYILGFSVKEAAKLMGVSASTVDRLLKEGREWIRKAGGPDLDPRVS